MVIRDEPDGATPLEAEEREGLKFSHVTTRAQLDHLEHANIQEGLRWLSRYRKDDLLQERFVRELHRRLFGQVWRWAGEFRRTEKNIGIDPRQISVQLRLLLDDAQYWVNHGTYPPLELATRLHHRLVYIHVFANGNGRHARIMADAVLTKLLDHDPIDWAGGHDLQAVNARRDAYLQALRDADRGEYATLLAFVDVDNDQGRELNG
jgi:Fic-DOC domain mobile mystery protein B